MSAKSPRAKLHSQTVRNSIISTTYTTIFLKMIKVVKNITFKNFENKIYEWFDREIAEKLSIRDNFFKIQIKPSQRGVGNLQRGKK